MTFSSSVNASNVHFQETSGAMEVADRLRQYPIGTTLNLGITYSGSVLSLTGADGTALSATNPAYVVIPSKINPGQKLIIKKEATEGFIDGSGASEIINNLFGLSTGVLADVDIPFYLYLVLTDNETVFTPMISRIPHATTSPAVANIGAPAVSVADTQGSFWVFDNVVLADYEQNPCVCIGSFRMRMSAADDWTVQALSNTDGIGKFQEGNQFSVPTGHFGAAAAKYFLDNGGTAPSWTTQNYLYTVSRAGLVNAHQEFETISVAGLGAVTALMVLPFASKTLGDPGGGDIGSHILMWKHSLGDAQTLGGFIVNAAAFLTMQNTNLVGGADVNSSSIYTIDETA